MKVLSHEPPSGNIDLRDQCNSSSQPFLERLDLREKPVGLPEMCLFREADQARVQNRPLRKGCLAVISRRVLRSLDQLLKLAAEDIVHSQLAGDLFGDIQAVRASCVNIHFLEDQNVRMRTR